MERVKSDPSITEDAINQAKGGGIISKPGRSGAMTADGDAPMDVRKLIGEIDSKKELLADHLIEQLRSTPDEEMSEEYHDFMAYAAARRAAAKALLPGPIKKLAKKKASKTSKQSRKQNRK